MTDSIWPTIHAERHSLADDLAALTPEQWATHPGAAKPHLSPAHGLPALAERASRGDPTVAPSFVALVRELLAAVSP